MRRALSSTGGNYRAVVQLFGMDAQDYKKMLNFLAAHDCVVDYREFRQGTQQESLIPQALAAERSKALAG
jgi:hypothetical protein